MRDDRGYAMMTVVLGVGAMLLMIVLVYQQSSDEYRNAQFIRREDTILAGGEAMLERYASKLTIDGLYYLHYVDEAELPRRCTDPESTGYGNIVQPGNAWYSDCLLWDYEEAGDPFEHPLLTGVEGVTADDVVALLTVSPPEGSRSVEVTVVARQPEFGQNRAIRAEIRPEAISEFAFLTEEDLRFGSGAVITGKLYTGDDLNFDPSPVQGIVYRDVFAEDYIGNESGYGPPIFAEGAQGYDGRGWYRDIRDVYPEPLDFEKFWADLDIIREVACGGAGLCLSRSENPDLGLPDTPTAWLIEPSVSGSQAELRVSASYQSPSYSCVNSEEWWWMNSEDASWNLIGTFDAPDSGAVWADGHVVIGLPGQTSTIKGQLTIYAGSNGSRKNIILGSDLVYHSGTSGIDVLGLISSDEIIINPSSVGSDLELNVVGAYLTQGGALRVARDCGDDGDVMLPWSGGVPASTLNTNGSKASRVTGDIAAHFSPRNYNFDPRLEGLRPPLFPLMREEWDYTNWREITLPCWALPETSPACSS